jgi:hypothetical protein
MTSTPRTASAAPVAAAPASSEQTASLTATEANPGEATPVVTTEPAKADDASKPPGAPEKYDFKAPEGSALNPEVMTEFEGIARELNLPQDAAQKLVDKMAPKIAAQQAEAFKQVQTQWTESTKADKEFGGDKLDARRGCGRCSSGWLASGSGSLSVAKRGLEAFGTPELKTLLNESGLGNHPEIIRAFFRAGKTVSADTFVPGGAGKGPQGGSDPATRLYGNQQSLSK